MQQTFEGGRGATIVFVRIGTTMTAEIETDDCQTLKVEARLLTDGDRLGLWRLSSPSDRPYLEHSDRSWRIRRLAFRLSNHHY